MRMLRARYGDLEVEYDADAPCWMCGLPVTAASMGGTVICPWCDSGIHRDGRDWTYGETLEFGRRFKESKSRAAARIMLASPETLTAG